MVAVGARMRMRVGVDVGVRVCGGDVPTYNRNMFNRSIASETQYPIAKKTKRRAT